MNPTACEAKQYGDTMMCGRCCMMWEVNTPVKPTCGNTVPAVNAAAKARADQAIAKAKETA